MATTARVPLSGATTTNRKWWLDVNTGTTAAPVWTPVAGITEFSPGKDQTTADNADFDSGGWGNTGVTGLTWTVTATFRRAPKGTDSTLYDDGQEFLRLKSDQIGVANTVEIRFYEMEPSGPRIEAYQGQVAVQYTDNGGSATDNSMAAITLTGQGRRNSIIHPASTAAAAPTVTAVRTATGTTTPVAGGGVLAVTGTGFLTVTSVVVFGNTVPANGWTVLNDQSLSIAAPAHAAGTGDVVVTSPSGTSGTSAGSKVTYA
jgi:hypothetical protein